MGRHCCTEGLRSQKKSPSNTFTPSGFIKHDE
jgi:hypothetical protein